MSFSEKLSDRIAVTGSNLCVGLDPRAEQIDGDLHTFCMQVIEETAPFAAAFKPNIAYFEAYGAAGYQVLEDLLQQIPDEVPVVLDVKRSDIPETQKYYAKSYFENWSVDAVTINSYLGFDSIEPFLQYEDRGVYLLGITSNPGAQDMELRDLEGRLAFEHVQDMARKSSSYPGDAGLVVGLTNVTSEILAKVSDVPLLVPGLGAQGGNLEDLQVAGRQAPLLINASRSILYGEPDKGFAAKAEAARDKIVAAING